MRNVIDAIIEVVSNPQHELMDYANSHNRANSMGAALEEYVKDIFAGTVGINDNVIRQQKISQNFSYLGNLNNPPDSILKNGDAIEVKKIESNDSSLALNSSYPKAKLYSNSPMISTACRNCEQWDEKDMLYVVGIINNNNLKSLAFVYGVDYCADKHIYERIKTMIKTGVESIEDVEFAETKEIGRVNRVDPLGITYLRIRGMWGIENPFKVFNYLFNRDHSRKFNFMALINDDKFYSFGNYSAIIDLANSKEALNISDVEIKNPNNPALTVKSKLITYIF